MREAEGEKSRLQWVPTSSAPAQWKGILLHSEGYEPPGQKPCLCTTTWAWGLKIKDEQPKYEASRHSCQAGISRPDDCSIMNALTHLSWLFCTIPYSLPQLLPSSVCLPTVTPTCALFLSPASSPFCLFGVQGLTGRCLFIQTLQNESSQFLLCLADCHSLFPSQIFIKFKFLEK